MGCCGWNAVHKTPTVPPGPEPSDARQLVALRRAHAEVALHEATGGAPLCRIDGPGAGLAKHAEGRLAAIAELDRALRDVDADADAHEVVGRLIERWRGESERTRGRGGAWEAYHSGGLAEIEAVAQALEDPSQG